MDRSHRWMVLSFGRSGAGRGRLMRRRFDHHPRTPNCGGAPGCHVSCARHFSGCRSRRSRPLSSSGACASSSNRRCCVSPSARRGARTSSSSPSLRANSRMTRAAACGCTLVKTNDRQGERRRARRRKRADLAVVRSDVAMSETGLTVAILHRNAVIFLAPHGSSVRKITDLDKKRLGMLRATPGERASSRATCWRNTASSPAR